ncbi:MAG: SlyX family protein [Deltaproteobacteria bacterium]|nr:SlyX family protein [Deltaproteobacteria bacterium]
MAPLSQKELEERIVDLESRISFMQVTLDELNSVITEQHSQIEDLSKRFHDIETAAKESLVEKDQSTKPPHY